MQEIITRADGLIVKIPKNFRLITYTDGQIFQD